METWVMVVQAKGQGVEFRVVKGAKRWSRGLGTRGQCGWWRGMKHEESWRGQSCGEYLLGEAVEVIGNGDLAMVVQRRGRCLDFGRRRLQCGNGDADDEAWELGKDLALGGAD